MELNPLKDLEIDIHDPTSEFKKLSLLLFRYYEQKADIERERDILKLTVKEIRGKLYKDLKAGAAKLTEAGISAELDQHPEYLAAERKLIDANRDLVTASGAVDSLKAKKDMLIQLAADRRKEM